MIATALSDAQLLEAARDGDESAFTELYVRHQAAARRLALSYRRASDPDDLVNEAFEKVLSILRRGGGPTESFRAYLFVTLRRIATDTIERSRDEPYDEVPEPVRAEERGQSLDVAERQIVLQAFESLPERWQAVLWQTTVEGHTPQELALPMGMTANATAALAYRAREKLRQAYLQAHLQAAPRPECEPFRSQLGGHVRDGLSTRDRTKVDNHLSQCAACQDLRAELLNINALLNQALVPYFAVAGEDVAALVLGSSSGGGVLTGGPVTLARKGYSKARNNPGPAVAVAALAVALAVGLVSNLGVNGSERAPDAAAGPVEEANQAAPGSSSTPSTGDSPDAADAADLDDPDVADQDAEARGSDEPTTTDPDGTEPADTPASTDGPGSGPTAPAGTSPSTEASAGPAPDAPAPSDPPPGSTTPAPADPPPTDPPPTTAPPPPSGVVVWNGGANRVEVTLHNPGPRPTEPMLMNISLRGGALTSGLPSGCTGVPLLVRTECLVGAIPAGGSRTVTQPVANAGPTRSASVSCTLGSLGLACSDVLSPSSTALG